MTVDPNAPAYPVPEQHGQQFAPHPQGPQWEQEWQPACQGITIRLAVAAQVLAAMATNIEDGWNDDAAAHIALSAADALIRACNEEVKP